MQIPLWPNMYGFPHFDLCESIIHFPLISSDYTHMLTYTKASWTVYLSVFWALLLLLKKKDLNPAFTQVRLKVLINDQ